MILFFLPFCAVLIQIVSSELLLSVIVFYIRGSMVYKEYMYAIFHTYPRSYYFSLKEAL